MKNIVLIGMPGCGKTTLGRIISRELKRKFYDIDNYIEEKTQKEISELFENGEDNFRDIESKAVKELAEMDDLIISTGGGVIKRTQNIEMLKTNGIIIFIDRPVDNIIGDVDISKRPLLKDGKDKVLKLYEERYEIYKAAADVIIVNDCDLDEVKNRILTVSMTTDKNY